MNSMYFRCFGSSVTRELPGRSSGSSPRGHAATAADVCCVLSAPAGSWRAANAARFSVSFIDCQLYHFSSGLLAAALLSPNLSITTTASLLLTQTLL